MPAEFDSGMFVREPAWHGLGNVIGDWPGSWEEARRLADLNWDVEVSPLYTATSNVDGNQEMTELPGYQLLRRSDTNAILSVQPKSYRVISNSVFGEVIEDLMGIAANEGLRYDTLISIYGGRMIAATVYLAEPLRIDGDPSLTFTYVAFTTRHDGQGGLSAAPTNVRVVCANTQRAAESEATDKNVFTVIKHTANWETRISTLRQILVSARKQGEEWSALASKLAVRHINDQGTKYYLDRFIPISTDMTDRMVTNANTARETVRQILASNTCAGIADTTYGLVMASTEYADHYRRAHTADTRINRSLLRAEPLKVRAFRIAKEMANIT